MKTKLALLAALLAANAWAQDQYKVFTVKPANVDRVQKALKMVVGDGNVNCETSSSTVVVRASGNLMPSVEQVVKDLDAITIPEKNIELTFYILEATKEPAADSSPLPAEIQPAIDQLKGVFSYRGFRLLDTAFIRGRSGGQWATVSGGSPDNYVLKLRPSVSSETQPATIRMDGLQFRQEFHVKNGTAMYSGNVFIESSVDVKEGQKVVIGKTTVQRNEGRSSALILVASGKVVD